MVQELLLSIKSFTRLDLHDATSASQLDADGRVPRPLSVVKVESSGFASSLFALAAASAAISSILPSEIMLH